MSAKTLREPVQLPYVRLECGFCQRKGGAYMGHYDLLRCVCGRAYWALQPHRGGPLVLVPWPGRDMAEAATIQGREGVR